MVIKDVKHTIVIEHPLNLKVNVNVCVDMLKICRMLLHDILILYCEKENTIFVKFYLNSMIIKIFNFLKSCLLIISQKAFKNISCFSILQTIQNNILHVFLFHKTWKIHNTTVLQNCSLILKKYFFAKNRNPTPVSVYLVTLGRAGSEYSLSSWNRNGCTLTSLPALVLSHESFLAYHEVERPQKKMRRSEKRYFLNPAADLFVTVYKSFFTDMLYLPNVSWHIFISFITCKDYDVFLHTLSYSIG